MAQEPVLKQRIIEFRDVEVRFDVDFYEGRGQGMRIRGPTNTCTTPFVLCLAFQRWRRPEAARAADTATVRFAD